MNKMHFLIISLVVVLLAIGSESLPAQTVNTAIVEESTLEGEPEHLRKKRAIQCIDSGTAYGSTVGMPFIDFPVQHRPGPCEVDITEIRIFWGTMVDSIQMTYKSLDGEVIQGPKRGGPGGGETVIILEDGEKITGAVGMVCDWNPATFVHQLIFFSEKADGQKSVHGPFGFGTNTNCYPFAVNAVINSIYGVTTSQMNPEGEYVGLGAIGFFFEDTGPAPQSTEGGVMNIL